MSAVEIRKVESRRDLQTFIDFHYDLYEGNDYDVPNLYTDEVNTLRKDKNAAFEFCDAEYYMAYKDGRLVGRVAAIINNRANELSLLSRAHGGAGWMGRRQQICRVQDSCARHHARTPRQVG